MNYLAWIGIVAWMFAAEGLALGTLGEKPRHVAVITGHWVNADPLFPQDAALAQDETDSQKLTRLYRTGQFREVASLAERLISETVSTTASENWLELKAQAELAVGDYDAAKITIDTGLERLPYSLRLRWLGAEVYRYHDLTAESQRLLVELNDQWTRNGWRYRTAEDQIVVAEYRLSTGADAKEILQNLLQPLKQRFPEDGQVDAAIARLALGKNDFAMAAENFQRAVDRNPSHPDYWFGLAQAYLPSDSEKTEAAMTSALAVDENYVPALLSMAEMAMHAEQYTETRSLIDRVLAINPSQPRAHATLAVLAHLNNDPLAESESRSRALAHWSGNPDVDHWIGLKLSQKYRFEDGATYQRRALVYDANYLPAKMQLAHDLLRLGQDLEGWKLAEQVFDRDQYNVVAHNLVTLRDRLSQFRTLSVDGFVVRMDAREADLYGQQVLELLRQAKSTLVEKYQATLAEPIIIEIFPKQQDFAIRTFGLPGGEGFLGVCFGRVITMNSPAALGSTRVSWQSVLWHEFCHVVTLQKTQNKMPRWLSEGISVWEERAADVSWGQSLDPQFREMLLGSDLVPISQLSGAFLKPASPMHLQFAYYQSSLAVQFLVERYGQDQLIRLLDDLATGVPINEALSKTMAPLAELDRDFLQFAKKVGQSFGEAWDWAEPDLPATATAQQWHNWNSENPQRIQGLLNEAEALMRESQWQSAAEIWSRIVTECPDGLNHAWLQLSQCYRELDRAADERQTLTQYCQRVSDDVVAVERLISLATAAADWPAVQKYADRWIAVQPLIATPYRHLAASSKFLGQLPQRQKALEALIAMAPVDVANLHFELAQVYREQGRIVEAKRAVLRTLEQAPRFMAAHELLKALVDAEVKATGPDSNQIPDSAGPAKHAPVEQDVPREPTLVLDRYPFQSWPQQMNQQERR